MPVLYPASPLRIERLRVGVHLTMMSRALGHSVSLLSLVERELIDRPAIKKRMKDFLSAYAAK
jgi:hypothetical protein